MTAKPQTSMIKPGDVIIDEITLQSYTGFKMSLAGLFDNFTIYEDIYSNFMSGSITLIESMNIVKHFPIIGAETLTIVYRTPWGGKNPVRLTFRTFKISAQVETSQQANQLVRIEFVSPQAIWSMQSKVSKSYKAMRVSDMVNSIYRDYLASDTTEDPLKTQVRMVDVVGGSSITRSLSSSDSKVPLATIQQTYDTRSYVIPYWTPLYTINWLSHRARSLSDLTHCDYVFYENSDGHHFVPLSLLKKARPEFTYTNYPKGLRSEKGERMIEHEQRNVLTMNVSSITDKIKQQHMATFASTILTHDLTTKSFNTAEYSYDTKYAEVGSHLNKYRMLPLGKTDYTRSPLSCLKYYPNSTYAMSGIVKAAEPEETILFRQSLLSQMNSIVLTLECWGDTNVKVGQVIDFIPLAKESAKNNDKFDDDYLKGRYLVTSIRHLVTDRSHRMTLTISKDSFSEPIADIKAAELQQQ